MTVAGVLVVDKPAGMTSHDVVSRVRKVFATRKVGHGGTLDPDVTGVLVLCVGDATRLLEYVAAETKTYEGEVLFGVATETDDLSGTVLESLDASRLQETEVHDAASALLGWQEQTVPRYSAIHVGGKRAYELARAGIPVEMPIRRVRIDELQVRGFRPGARAEASFRVTCSKGTYIRALCRDWGTGVGFPACMKSLRRTASGMYGIEEAVPLANLESSMEPEQFIFPPLTALRGMPRIVVCMQDVWRLTNGQKLVLASDSLDAAAVGTVVAVLTAADELVAVAEVIHPVDGEIVIKPKKVFWKREG